MADTEFNAEDNCATQLIEPSRVKFALAYYGHLRRLSDYVEKNIDKPFQLEDIASRIGVSASRLSHLFADKAGCTYSVWIRNKRVKRATELLRSGDRTILEIAFSVGFESVRTFERSFSKVMGKSPSSYRRQFVSQNLSY